MPQQQSPEQQGSSVPIISLVNNYLHHAVRLKASDIHFEPDEDFMRVRLRIDGRLHEVGKESMETYAAVIARIKVLGNLDIAEPKKYQDGRFPFVIEDRRYDIRFSIFPTIYGSVAVLRILNTTSIELGLDPLGMADDQREIFEGMIKRPYGMLLVTGPNGSGKTTTLYSALHTINSTDISIATLEDPVEYQLPLLRQSQIDVERNLTFANGLRALLRQDPDVIMVGEIRDAETAKIAVQASMTGHLVLSTLHTNNSIGALVRIVNMGVETFLVAYATVGVLAQRLVRVLCNDCKQETEIDPIVAERLGMEKGTKVFKSVGCNKCNDSGYRGRTGIFELLVVDEQLRHMLFQKATIDELYKYALSQGMKTLRVHGIEKVKQGVTSIDEVLSITESGL
ncbi:MAG: GspE/PulE family protein [Patescibacteria group bacterium]